MASHIKGSSRKQEEAGKEASKEARRSKQSTTPGGRGAGGNHNNTCTHTVHGWMKGVTTVDLPPTPSYKQSPFSGHPNAAEMCPEQWVTLHNFYQRDVVH